VFRPPRVALLLAAATALALWFHGGLLFGGALHGFDWAIHWHYYDWTATGLREHGALPLYMRDAWHTPNFVANAQAPISGPLVPLLLWLETDAYLKTLIVLYTAAGLAGGFLLGRDLGARPVLAGLASACYGLGGFFAAHVAVGHHWALGAYLLPVLLLLVRRALGGSRAALAGAAAVNGLALLEGQHHPFLWQNAFLLTWAGLASWRVRDARHLRVAGTVVALAAGLAAVRLVPALFEFAGYAPSARIAGIPPAALPFSLTAAEQGPGTAGFGIDFHTGSGWWEYAFYLGWPGLGFVGVGAAAAGRRHAALLGAGALFGLLALDTRALGFDVWSWLQHLPGTSSQRAPARLLLLALFAACMAAGPGWERLLRALPASWGVLRRLVPGACALLALGVALDLGIRARPWQRAAVGEPLASRPHRLPDPRLRGSPDGSLEVLRAGPNGARFRVRSDGPAWLVFPVRSDAQRGQWDAAEQPVLATPRGLLAVRVGAGEEVVEMRFRPRGLRVGLAGSLLTVLGVAGWLVHGRGSPRCGEAP